MAKTSALATHVCGLVHMPPTSAHACPSVVLSGQIALHTLASPDMRIMPYRANKKSTDASTE